MYLRQAAGGLSRQSSGTLLGLHEPDVQNFSGTCTYRTTVTLADLSQQSGSAKSAACRSKRGKCTNGYLSMEKPLRGCSQEKNAKRLNTLQLGPEVERSSRGPSLEAISFGHTAKRAKVDVGGTPGENALQNTREHARKRSPKAY